MLQRRTYRFRIEPTRQQAAVMNGMAGARRWVWNWALARRKQHYEATKTMLSVNTLSAEMTALKKQPETAWLVQYDSQALQQVLRDLNAAFASFFKKVGGFPKFKSRKNDAKRFRIPQRVKIAKSGNSIYVPKVGTVKLRNSWGDVGKTKSASFRCSPTGQWHVSLVSEFDMPDAVAPYKPERVVGIDVGLANFAVISDGTVIAPPKFCKNAERRVRKAQKALSRCKIGSRRRERAKIKLARIHGKLKNRRADFLHKLSTELIRKYDRVCIEDLSVKSLMATKQPGDPKPARTKRAKGFADAAFGEFRRQLAYKGLWNSKPVVIINRYFPSSKLCPCGKLADLKLSDRKWTCECGLSHDRDALASQNIHDEGLRMLAAG